MLSSVRITSKRLIPQFYTGLRGLTRSLSSTQCLLRTKPSSLLNVTEEESMIREAARRYARQEIEPLAASMDESEIMDKKIIDGLFQNGFMAIECEEEYGGTGASFTSACMVIEELARIDPSVSVLCDVQNTLVVTGIRRFGSEEQKQEFLPRLAKDTVGSFCLSEASSGSDAFAMKARAVDKGDHYVLNGSKMWITNAAEAGMFIVYANAEPEKKHRGITAFLVDRAQDGVEVGKRENKLGLRASSTCPVHLSDVKVPKERVLGDVGQGYKYAMQTLNEGRIGIGAQMLGLAQGCFDATMPYLFERKQFGQFIGDFGSMQAEYADVAMEIEAARALVYNAARMKEEGRNVQKEAAIAKLKAAIVAQQTATKCVEWMGGVGFTKDMPQERYFRSFPIGAIYEGTSLVQRATIAKLLRSEYAEGS